MLLRDRDGLTEAEFLAAYRASDYPRPSVACDMAVFAVAREEADSYRQLPEPLPGGLGAAWGICPPGGDGEPDGGPGAGGGNGA